MRSCEWADFEVRVYVYSKGNCFLIIGGTISSSDDMTPTMRFVPIRHMRILGDPFQMDIRPWNE